MATVPLILKAEPVTRLDGRDQRRRDPTVAIVYVRADGTVELVDGGKPINWQTQLTGRYRMRYEVDMSHHGRTIELRSAPPPARGNIHHFDTQLSIGFRVIDPEGVVRYRVEDGLRLVSDFLIDEIRKISAGFDITDAKDVEDTVNAAFRGGVVIGGVVELFTCKARMKPDAASVAYLLAKERAERDNIVKSAEHETNVDDARRTNEVTMIEQSGTLLRRRREHEALAGRSLDAQDMIKVHLENNPTDTAGALQMAFELEARRETARVDAETRQWDRLKFMVDRDLVQAVDVGPIRDKVIGGSTDYVAAALPTGTAAAGWDDPLPVAGMSAPPGLVPFYLVIDGSSALAPAMAAVEAGLQSMYDALAGDAEVANVIRLAVLSYSDRASIRMALRAVQSGVRLPAMPPGVVPAKLAAVFEQLMDCIPRDAETLKAQTSSLRRPQVILLSGGRPMDDPGWQDAHHRLVDRVQQRYAPDVVACGIGGAPPRTMLSIATRPELAFVSQQPDVDHAIERFYTFARHRMLDYGRAVLDGDQTSLIVGPEGFRPAAELLATPYQGD